MTIPWNFTGCYSIEEWKKIIEDWEKSRLTMNAYCKMRRISPTNFYRWHKKIYPSNSLSFNELRERWKQVIKNWEKSGLSKHAYCMERGLNLSMFYLREKEFNPDTLRKTSHMKAVERWDPIVKDWKVSGLNKWQYCLKHGLTYNLLCKWINNLDSSDDSSLHTDLINTKKQCVETPLQDHLDPSFPSPVLLTDPSQANQKIEVVLSHGQFFRLRGPFDWPNLIAWLIPLLTK